MRLCTVSRLPPIYILIMWCCPINSNNIIGKVLSNLAGNLTPKNRVTWDKTAQLWSLDYRWRCFAIDDRQSHILCWTLATPNVRSSTNNICIPSTHHSSQQKSRTGVFCVLENVDLNLWRASSLSKSTLACLGRQHNWCPLHLDSGKTKSHGTKHKTRTQHKTQNAQTQNTKCTNTKHLHNTNHKTQLVSLTPRL